MSCLFVFFQKFRQIFTQGLHHAFELWHERLNSGMNSGMKDQHSSQAPKLLIHARPWASDYKLGNVGLVQQSMQTSILMYKVSTHIKQQGSVK